MSSSTVHLTSLCLVGVLLSACSPSRNAGQSPDPSDFGRAWLEAWDSHNVDQILTFYNPDAFYEDVPSVVNGWDTPLRGHDMIEESLDRTFAEMPDLGFEFVRAAGTGDDLVVEWIMTGTRYRDVVGAFSIRAVSVVQLHEGRIARVSDYYDAYHLLSQLGIISSVDAGSANGGENPPGD